MDQKIAYGTASQGITATLASLASAAARQSTAIDNTGNLFIDALLYLALKLQTGTPSGDKVIKIWFFASEDGTNYTDNAGASDAGITLSTPNNLFGPFIIQTPTLGGLTWKAVVPVAQFFGGVLPAKWGIVIQNSTGIALSATEADHTKEYRGVYFTIN